MDTPFGDSKSQAYEPVRWWAQLSASLLIAAELIWVMSWYQTIAMVSTPPAAWRALLVLGTVMVASYGVTLAIEGLRLISQLRFVLLGGLLLVFLIAANALLLPAAPIGSHDGVLRLDPLFLITIGFVLWLWSRGIGLGSQVIRPASAWRRFQVGLFNLMVYTLLTSVLDLPSSGLGIYMLYLFCGLGAVTMARIAYVGVSRSARKNPFNRGWALSIGGSLALVILTGTVFAGIVTGQFRSVLDALAGGFGIVVAVIIFIFSIPGLILVYLISPLAPWLREQLGTLPPQVTPDPGLINPYPFGEVPETGPLPLNIQVFCFWSLVGLAVIVVFFAARNAYRRRRVGIAEGPESILSQEEARNLARRTLDDWLDNLAARFRQSTPVTPLARVRQIYIQLLALGADLRRPRPPSATPHEYLTELIDAIPNFDVELGSITQAYQHVRYGEAAVWDVESLENEWKKVAESGKRLKKNLPRLNETKEPPDADF